MITCSSFVCSVDGFAVMDFADCSISVALSDFIPCAGKIVLNCVK